MSAVTGTPTAATTRVTRPTAASRESRSPSAAPRLQATPALVVATARAPARSTIRALAASQALGSTRTAPECSARNSSVMAVTPARPTDKTARLRRPRPIPASRHSGRGCTVDGMVHALADSPIGPITLTGTGGALTGLYMTEHRYAPASFGARDDDAFPDALAQLAEYFAGTRRTFDLELAPAGTPFQQRVWAALREIPYGETTTYGELAATIGRPTA